MGFFFNNFFPLPVLAELKRWFEVEIVPHVVGQNPFSLTNRLARSRGGNIRALPYHVDQAIDQALWDMQGKVLDLPLYRLLGGREKRVQAYASGLDFHLSHAGAASLIAVDGDTASQANILYNPFGGFNGQVAIPAMVASNKVTDRASPHVKVSRRVSPSADSTSTFD